MNIFKFTICVMLSDIIMPYDDRTKVVGYYRVYRVKAESLESARELVVEDVTDGTIDWSDSAICEEGEDTFEYLQRNKIKYKSGRIFFPEQE